MLCGCRFGDRHFPVANVPYPDYFGGKAIGSFTVSDIMACIAGTRCPPALVPAGTALANGSTPFYVFERLFLEIVAPEIQKDFPKVSDAVGCCVDC